MLNWWYKVEIGWIVWLQRWTDAVPFFRWFTDVALDSCLLVAIGVLIFRSWGNGFKLLFVYCLGQYTNIVLKLAFGTPRPFWISDEIQAHIGSGSFGMPSGHVLETSSIWIAVAYLYPRRWVVASVIAIVALVSFSRVYLGVHFVIDVLVGIGIALILAWVGTRDSLCGRFMWSSSRKGHLAFLAFVLVLGLVAWLTLEVSFGRAIPEAWPQNLLGIRSVDPILRGGVGLIGLKIGAHMLLSRYQLPERLKPFAVVMAVGYLLLSFYLLKELSVSFFHSFQGGLGSFLRALRFGLAAWIATFLVFRLFANLATRKTHD